MADTATSMAEAPVADPASSGSEGSVSPVMEGITLPSDLIHQLVEAGVHFGHRSSRWNPKMARYIYTKRNHIHIIDLKHTVRGLLRAANFLQRVAASGGEVLVVGTKRQAQEAVREVAVESGMSFVTERWLGGTLTNHDTIRQRLKRLDDLDGLEQTGSIAAYSKKMQVRLKRERDKIFRNLEGIRMMEDKPTALIVVDARRETIALKEAEKLKIPTIAIIDTDSDPDMCDIVIPGNDDATRSIRLLLGFLGQAVALGRQTYKARAALRIKEAQEAERAERAERGAQRQSAPRPKPAEAPVGIQRKVIQPAADAEGSAAAPDSPPSA